MPLALLLQANTRALLSGSVRLATWNELVELEALLVARARSAFLVRWFGPGLPLAGSRLRIAIVNLPALRARYHALEAATRPPEGEGLDIVPPLAVMFGNLAGAFINPLVLLTVLVSGALGSITRILVSLGGVLLGPLGAVLFSVAGPFLLAPLLFSSPKELVEGYPLALAIGALFPPLTEFFDALNANFVAIFGSLIDLAALFGIGDAPSPPGDMATATTILEGILPLSDKLAVFVPLLLQGLAFLIVRVGPLLEPLSIVLPAFLLFVFSAIEALKALFADIVDGFERLFDSSKGALSSLLAALHFKRRLLAPFRKDFGALFAVAKGILKDRKADLAAAFQTLIEEAAETIKTALLHHPLIAFFNDLITQAKKLIREILATVHKAARAAAGEIGEHISGTVGRKLATDLFDALVRLITPSPSKSSLVDDLIAFLKQAVPDHKKILAGLKPPLTVKEAIPGKLHSEQPPEVPAELLERHSVFTAERAALFRGPALQAADERERRLRGFLFDVVARLLPDKAAPHLASLRGFLQTLDQEIDRERGRRELPVRQPPDPARLRPAVRKLRLAVRGAARDEADRWGQELAALLRTQDYVPMAPATAIAGGAR